MSKSKWLLVSLLLISTILLTSKGSSLDGVGAGLSYLGKPSYGLGLGEKEENV